MVRIPAVLSTFVLLALCCAAALGQTDAKAVVAPRYAELDRLYVARDVPAIMALYAPDCVVVDTDGTRYDRAAATGLLISAFSRIAGQTAHSSVRQAAFVKGQIVATVSSVSDLTFKDGPPGQILHIETMEEDTWMMHGGAWLLRQAIVQDSRYSVDGKEVMHRTAVRLPVSEQDALVRQIQTAAMPLSSARADTSNAELGALGRMIGDARLVGLGEGTHGTSEFFSLKDRIVRYLVEEKGFRVFGIEAAWTVGLDIDRYITTGAGDPRELLNQTFAVWNNQEVLDLVEWLRRYNVAHPRSQVRFVGFDMQESQEPVALVNAFAQKNLPADADALRASLQCAAMNFMVVLAKNAQAKNECRDSVARAAAILERHVGPGSFGGEGKIALQSMRVVVQSIAMALAYDPAKALGGYNERDQAMADNVTWIAHTLYPRERIALWAHNGHVSATAISYVTMGTHLREAFGKRYFVVGFTFDHGEVSPNGVSPNYTLPAPAPATSEAMFRRVSLPMYYVDLHALASKEPAHGWLMQPLGVSMLGAIPNREAAIGGREASVVLPNAFDALVFVDEGHAAHSFKQGMQGANTTSGPLTIANSTGGATLSRPWSKAGWGSDAYEVGADESVRHGPTPSLYVKSATGTIAQFGTVSSSFDLAPFRGKRVRVSGFLRGANIEGWGGFWARIDPQGGGESLAFDNMYDRPITGTSDWKPFEILLKVPAESGNGYFGLLLSGKGQIWADDVTMTEAP